ncbi:hypothetical protein K1T73_00235 [Roseovarius sp. SCSIO 43702]|nr:hypothetical protein K1T73_00235 [Roseovarius sp. SCSIO 43702]
MSDADAAARAIFERTGGEVRLALPLGLGKPVTLVNALVRYACEHPETRLTIFTALTLEVPATKSDVEKRFLEPASDRLFGAYPQILYADLMRRGRLPANIEVTEFFLLAGRWLGVETMQQSYVSANYTHARDVLIESDPNVLVQLVPEREGRFSLSCNTDISTDLFDMRRAGKIDFMAVAEIGPELPFLDGAGAILDAGEFAMVLEPEEPFELFSAVKRPVDDAAQAIGLHVSRLVADGGTLQIGIGAIGDAVAHALRLRHRGEAQAIQAECPFPVSEDPGGSFKTGLYAVTEMFVGGLLTLYEEGVLRREVDGKVVHAGFFVDTRDFYRRLREMPEAKREKIAMMPVSFTNQLYGDEAAKRAARVKARFVNGAMKVSLLGDVMSDTVANGQVVSGVGGQFNFVEQAFALDDALSVITLPATRRSGGKLESNVCWTLDSVTVPRHMRDAVVTEYGIARLRGLSDAEVIARMIEIADSRFQDELLRKAKAAGKLPESYTIPQTARQNLPDTVRQWLVPHRDRLPAFPFGTDFDEIEQVLLPALERLGDLAPSLRGKLLLLAASVTQPAHPQEDAAMARMGYGTGGGLTARALRGALRLVAAEARGRD